MDGQAGHSDRERAELIRGLYRSAPVGVAGALLGVGALCWILIYIAPDRAPRAEIWFALTVAVAIWQLALCAWYWRARAPDSAWRVWARRFVIASFAEGVRWGFGSLWLAAPGQAEQQLWVIMVVACSAAGSVSSLGSYIPAFYALLIPAVVPFVIWGATWGIAHHDPRYWIMALMAFAFGSTVGALGFGQSRSLAEALRLRFENLDLVDDLREQKELAEQASMAKTQFLAAASHDLRQPIHALVMFVAALGRKRMGEDARRLTGQISDSVNAMTGLFDSLLDVSQLDAGVVQPAPQSFAIQPLLDRICREQASELRDRPVALRQVPSSAVVHTDPILLERMLRNVIANAVRHTERGRILVGCRRGARLGVEIWDTGPGIPEAHHQQIFEAYYQLANPERDRAKGLGLGLAITRRLSLLLDCPITLRSEAGKGSAFHISVPTAGARAAAPEVAAPPPAADPQGLVFVIDDEAAIRQGMAELLQAWGYEVSAAGSAADLMAGVDPGRRPDLLICDWRLRGEETAPGAIATIRAAFGADIPAMLITGDTAPERLRDAHQTGLVLLHKPVAAGKLRAAIGNLMRLRPATAEVR